MFGKKEIKISVIDICPHAGRVRTILTDQSYRNGDTLGFNPQKRSVRHVLCPLGEKAMVTARASKNQSSLEVFCPGVRKGVCHGFNATVSWEPVKTSVLTLSRGISSKRRRFSNPLII